MAPNHTASCDANDGTDRAGNIDDRADLADLAVELGEDDDGRVWKITLRALASPITGDPRAEQTIEKVAGQVYAMAEPEHPGLAETFVRGFLDAYEIQSTGDVNDLLARETHERQQWIGQVGMAEADA